MKTVPAEPAHAARAPAQRARLPDARPGVLWSHLAPLSLFWRVFLLNAVLLIVATVALALSPATVSFPVRAQQVYVLAGGLAALLAANALLLRISLAPLRELAGLMRRIDLLIPGARLQEEGASELRAVTATFNEMLGRLELERRSSSTRAVGKQEDERRRIARELHDEVGQGLTAVLLQLRGLTEDAPADLQPGLVNAQAIVSENLDGVRRIARRLRPTVLDDLGLAYAIHSLLDVFEESAGLTIERDVASSLPQLPAPVELALFRIAQESVTNVIRHANATRLELRLQTVGEKIVELVVRDDGRGMVAVPDLEGDGMRGMRERALAIDATLRIRSAPGRGTTVSVTARVAAP